MLLRNLHNQILGKLFIFKNLPTFWKLMVWIEKIQCAKAASNGSLLSKTLSEILLSFGPFSAELPHFEYVL